MGSGTRESELFFRIRRTCFAERIISAGSNSLATMRSRAEKGGPLPPQVRKPHRLAMGFSAQIIVRVYLKM